MISSRELRRHLGRTRDRLLYGRRDARLARAAEDARLRWIDEATARLTPLPSAPRDAALEVHTLTGEKQSVMGIWSAWSLMRFLPEARLVVHSDGSLTADTVRLWQRAMPGCVVIQKDETLKRSETELARFPRVLSWTRSYHFGIKMGGYYTACQAPQIIELDTDALTLRPPEALLRRLSDSTCRMAWNQDDKPHYGYPLPILMEVWNGLIGPDFPDRLNAGYMLSYRYGTADWELLEALLARVDEDPRTDPLRYWMHQTYCAGLASVLGEAARPLPEEYDVHFGATRPEDTVRHYVGVSGVRPRFFTEGVERVVRDARTRGQLPAAFAADAVPA